MALNLTGTCTCRKLQYTVKLDSADTARTSLCHCSSCKKAFGTNFGLTSKVCRYEYAPFLLGRVATRTNYTVKPVVLRTSRQLTTQIPIESFKYNQGEPKLFKQQNGVVREFCGNCGSFTCEYGVNMHCHWHLDPPFWENGW